jgi:hypothetical protein
MILMMGMMTLDMTEYIGVVRRLPIPNGDGGPFCILKDARVLVAIWASNASRIDVGALSTIVLNAFDSLVSVLDIEDLSSYPGFKVVIIDDHAVIDDLKRSTIPHVHGTDEVNGYEVVMFAPRIISMIDHNVNEILRSEDRNTGKIAYVRDDHNVESIVLEVQLSSLVLNRPELQMEDVLYCYHSILTSRLSATGHGSEYDSWMSHGRPTRARLVGLLGGRESYLSTTVHTNRGLYMSRNTIHGNGVFSMTAGALFTGRLEE